MSVSATSSCSTMRRKEKEMNTKSDFPHHNDRRRKVRCNEVHPKCGHCSRLHLSCTWPPDSSFVVPGTTKVSKTKSKSKQEREKRQSQQQAQPQPQPKSRSQSPQKQQQLISVQEQGVQSPSARQPLFAQAETQANQPQQIIPEADFNEIFNYASFLWDNDSPTISFPTGSSPLDSLSTPHDQLQLPMPIAVSEAMKRTASAVVPPLFMSDRWVSDNGNFIPAASGVNVSESELSDYFARSTAPPILAPLETSSRWSRMRKMLIYMCKKSEMVKNAVMAFAALQLESPRSGSRTIHTQYYALSRDMLTQILAEVSMDQKRLTVELRHILATVFLLTYIDLLDDDVFKAHGNLRDAFHVIQCVRNENLSLTGSCHCYFCFVTA